MSKRRANYRNTLAAAVLATVTVQSAFAQTTWLNAGTDFATVTNWNAGVPNATTLAVFPSIAAPVNPGVAFGTKTALGLSIDNTLGDYNVTSDTSSLETFSGGITLTGDGTTTIDAPLTLQANQAFTVPANGTLVANSGINVNGKQLTKLGLGTLILTGNGGSNLGPAAANRFIVNGGVVQLQSINPFGDPTPGSYNMLLKAGSTFEIKPATTDVAWGVSFDTTLGTLAGGFIEMENGTTLRALAGNTGAEAGEFGGGRSARIVNGSTVTLDAPDLDSIFVMASFMGNATETLAASGSKVNITGSGQMYLQGGTVGANAYTGAWDVQMSTADFGIVFTNSNASWGARTGGAPAQVTLTSGFAVDPNTSAANATSAGTSPITMNGGIYALSQAQALRTLPAQWNGSMTVNDVATGNFIRLAEVFSGVTGAKNMDVNQAGVFSGTGLLDIFGNTALGGPGTFFLKNTSTVTPNTFDGVLQVESGAAVDASTTATGSNPLGTGDVFLFGGGLTLNHPGAGTITTYASTTTLVSFLNTTDAGGTITVGNGGSATTNSVVQLGLLQLDSDGLDTTVVFGNASATSNYSISLGNLNSGTAGNSILAAGANPANVVVRGIVLGAANLTKDGNYTLTFNAVDRAGVNPYTGGTTVSGGTLAFNTTARINSLAILGGTAKINPTGIVGAAGTKVLRVSALNIGGSSNLDITDNDVVVDSGAVSDIRSALQSGVSGSGIKSSTNTGNPARSIGYATGAQLGGAYRGEALAAGDVVIHSTFKGDANLDGKTNTIDFNALAGNFGANAGTSTWTEGDFNYDGNINSLDFSSLAAGYGSKETLGAYAGPLPGGLLDNELAQLRADVFDRIVDSTSVSGMTQIKGSMDLVAPGLVNGQPGGLGTVVPEPTSLAVLGLAALGLAGRRRRA